MVSTLTELGIVRNTSFASRMLDLVCDYLVCSFLITFNVE